MTYQKPKRFIKFLIFNFNIELCILNFKLTQTILIILILLLFPSFTIASEPNNKFGIHLAQPQLEDLESAAKLVNATGGDWGYITLVIQEDDRKQEKWQAVFNRMRQLHLIPIIRLATKPSDSEGKPEGAIWRRPTTEDIDEWIQFLDSLHWVVKNRYLILFNEPNHGTEWGGVVDPENYSQLAVEFAKKLKEKNPDFFVMLAGLDASAPSSPPNFEEEEKFLQRVLNFEIRNPKSETNSNFENSNFKNCFDFRASCFEFLVDGLASHSYPNPDFSGSPYDSGRGSVRSYQWELALLESVGVTKQLPVFITETGWRRGDEKMVADNLKFAFENVWLPDERVKAVTPFILNYQGEPFLNFSWQKFQSQDFFQQYYLVQSLAKSKGEPEQREKGEIIFELPDNLVTQSSYQFSLRLKNVGQAIWDKDNGYELRLLNDRGEKKMNYLVDDLKDIQPFEEKEIIFFVKTDDQLDKQKIRFLLQKGDKKILESQTWLVRILPLPKLNFFVNLFPKLNDQGENFELQIFDNNQKLVFVQKNQRAFGGRIVLDSVKNVVVGEQYRVVVLKSYYLPRQNFIVFKQNDNQVKFKPMVPVDFDIDGRLSFSDLITLIKKPKLLNLFLP